MDNKTVQPESALQAWRVTGQYPDSHEDHYEDYVLMPHDWDEDRVQRALIARAETEDDNALVEVLEQTALFERVPHVMVGDQLYVLAQTTNAVYR